MRYFTNMTDRIKRIIEDKGLQSSSFADKIQVSRGTISHILKGRNDPSKDTIDKILKNFPDISSSWFLSGAGPMYNRERIAVQSTSTTVPPGQSNLFDEKKPEENSEKQQDYGSSQKDEAKKAGNKTDSISIKNINPSSIPSKKIEKIMIFFSDKTFMTFIPED